MRQAAIAIAFLTSLTAVGGMWLNVTQSAETENEPGVLAGERCFEWHFKIFTNATEKNRKPASTPVISAIEGSEITLPAGEFFKVKTGPEVVQEVRAEPATSTKLVTAKGIQEYGKESVRVVPTGHSVQGPDRSHHASPYLEADVNDLVVRANVWSVGDDLVRVDAAIESKDVKSTNTENVTVDSHCTRIIRVVKLDQPIQIALKDGKHGDRLVEFTINELKKTRPAK